LETAFRQELARFKRVEGIDMNTISEECVFTPNNKTDLQPPVEVQQFTEILCTAANKVRPVVVLVDEYDHHLLVNSENSAARKHITHFLKTFFLQIKNSAASIKLAVVTGVTTSSFMVTGTPGADFKMLSIKSEYAGVAGISEEELKIYGHDYIHDLANKRGVPPEKIMNEIKEWYNGFTFTSGMEKIYNPESVVNYFWNGMARIYWADHGRPDFVWKQLKKRPVAFEMFKSTQKVVSDLRGFHDLDIVDPAVLLFEGGYLSIKEYHRGRANPYVLDFPNREVRLAFFQDLITAEKIKSQKTDIEIVKMKNAIEMKEPDFNNFIFVIGTTIRRLALKFDSEAAFHGIMWALMKNCGLERLELPGYKIQDGEIDIYAETHNTLVLLELKYNRHNANEVFKEAQTRVRHFIQMGKNILVAGVNFMAGENNPHPKTKTGVTETVLSDWYGELLDEKGTFIRSYSSKGYPMFKWIETTTSNTHKRTVTSTESTGNKKTT